jgi:hypothetical protein
MVKKEGCHPGEGRAEINVYWIRAFAGMTNTGLTQKGLSPLSLWERVRVRGLKNKEFFLLDPLIPAFSRREKGSNA